MSRISNRQLVIAFLACRLSSDMITLPAAMVRYGTERFYAILLAKIVLLAVYLPVIFVSLKYKGDSVITAAVRRNKAFGVILGVIMTIIITKLNRYNNSRTNSNCFRCVNRNTISNKPSMADIMIIPIADLLILSIPNSYCTLCIRTGAFT